MNRKSDKLTLRLSGQFRVTNAAGEDITPGAKKAQALLALLATSKDLQRTRSWLQDKLWSLSDGPRAAASLRQTLTAIRRDLGEHADVLSATRQVVSLDPASVAVEWDKDARPGGAEFLEGFELQDPEFADWLQTMRGKVLAVQAPQSAAAQRASRFGSGRWKLVLLSGPDSVSTSYHLECEFIDLLTRNLNENGEIELLYSVPDHPGDNVFVVDVNAVQPGEGQIGLRISARHAVENRVFWSESAKSSKASGSIEQSLDLLNLAFRLQTAVHKEIMMLTGSGTDGLFPPVLLGTAIPQIFSFKPGEVARASQLLDECLDERNAATFWGWQAQIAVINLIERFTDAPEACIEKGKALAAKAVEADPMNSMVLSTAANAQILLDWDIAAGGELASLAIRVNPSNPFGWWSYANAALYSDQAEKSLQAAQIASKLSAKSPLQFWCDFQVGLAALNMGDLKLAVRSLEISAALAPRFRPPRRYLLALYSHLGQVENAERTMQQLKRLEPGFSLDAFLNDPDYPISLAKRAKIIDSRVIAQLTDQS
ncbi:hypothetical protein EI983_17640 [Roseovarius faecimaris]|uniref:SARP family transcriptional regulator n=1 Tax=Roseovarius faecimaris TaxID=2494550 RepID=A0A6I6IUT8_9RHOB|nr:hypothetical protein [Roseovarius faecimaris]QGX99992.1 hypothetical protein EI983_17640 [Roseovarius faecimaris]